MDTHKLKGLVAAAFPSDQAEGSSIKMFQFLTVTLLCNMIPLPKIFPKMYILWKKFTHRSSKEETKNLSRSRINPEMYGPALCAVDPAKTTSALYYEATMGFLDTSISRIVNRLAPIFLPKN